MVPRMVRGLRFDDIDELDGTKQLLLPCRSGRRLAQQRAGLSRDVSAHRRADEQQQQPGVPSFQDKFLIYPLVPYPFTPYEGRGGDPPGV